MTEASGTPSAGPTLALVGATGRLAEAVAARLALSTDRWGEIRLLSPRMTTRTLPVRGREQAVEVLTEDSFAGVDVAMLNLPAEQTPEVVAAAVAAGATVIDTSPVHRLDPDVPLVVPGINGERAQHRPKGVVALPGAVTWALIDTAHVLHQGWELQHLVVTGMIAADAVSEEGVERLRAELRLVADQPRVGYGAGEVRAVLSDLPEDSPFPAPLAMNVVPWVGEAAEDGWTTAEAGLSQEVAKILELPELSLIATLVQVPVVSGHSLSLHARCARPVNVERVRQAVVAAPALIALDDSSGEVPTPVDVVGIDPRFVGRIRQPAGQRHLVELFLSAGTLRRTAGAMLDVAETIAFPAS